MSDSSEEETPALSEAPEVTVGQRLREAREARGESQQDVALHLNLTQRYVQALESDDYKALPGAAYVKGYIRAYARHLKISGDELVQIYAQSQSLAASSQLGTVNKIQPQARLGDPLIKISLYVFLFAILAASVWWWQAQSDDTAGDTGSATQSQSSPQSSESAEATGSVAGSGTIEYQSRSAVETESAPDNPSAVEAVPGADSEARIMEEDAADLLGLDAAPSDDRDPAAVTGAPQAQPTPAAETAVMADEQAQEPRFSPSETDTLDPIAEEPATAAEMLAGEAALDEAADEGGALASDDNAASAVTATLKMTFSNDCWVSIRDADEKLVFANTKRAGETLEIELGVPARLLVGRVSAVASASFGGEPLDLRAHANKEVARMTLDQ